MSNGFEDDLGNQIPNMDYFNFRIGQHEDRIRNLHLIYSVIVKATAIVGESLMY